jgi:hypothetical protein
MKELTIMFRFLEIKLERERAREFLERFSTKGLLFKEIDYVLKECRAGKLKYYQLAKRLLEDYRLIIRNNADAVFFSYLYDKEDDPNIFLENLNIFGVKLAAIDECSLFL